MPSVELNHVLLSFPSLIHLAEAASKEKAPRSWIQVARTGSFTSNRYGTFSITKTDLSTMLHNFDTITPKAPTELPVDFDHLSMDPKKPGDGVAAGWMKKLELRENGDELWAEVEWTPDGAERIAKQEYRFVSPSFVKDHVHKDGTKIGTTLIAAAITNHPFLEGMKALTLYNFSALGDLATETPPETPPEPKTVHLTDGPKKGQVVTFREDAEATPELTPDERAQVFTVTDVKGLGDDGFVKLENVDGKPYGWYPVTALAPADAPQKKEKSPMPKDTKPVQMSATEELNALALSVAKERHIPLNLAASIAAGQRKDLVEARQNEIRGGTEEPEAAALNVHNLRRDAGESIPALVGRVARERTGGDLRAATRLVGESFPTAMAEYEAGVGL